MDLTLRPIGRPRSCECGVCPKCKHRIYMKSYYQSKSPEERRRLFVSGRNPERVAAHEKARAKTAAKKDSIKRSQLRYPEKVRARRIVDNDLRRGKMTRGPCVVCGNTKTEAHHDDYTRPRDVIWLCRQHHVERH